MTLELDLREAIQLVYPLSLSTVQPKLVVSKYEFNHGSESFFMPGCLTPVAKELGQGNYLFTELVPPLAD